MRGGTSKGVFFNLTDLPQAAQVPGEARDKLLLRVIGSPDPVRGEVVRAHVVLRAGAELDEARLIERVRTRLSPHVAPRQIVAETALPMTATGKVMRRELRGR